MRDDVSRKDVFHLNVERAMAEAEAGRAELIAKLANLSLQDLAKVPPSTIAALGAGGLARLTAARGDLPSALSPPERRVPGAEPSAAAMPRRSVTPMHGPIFVGLSLALVLAAGPVFDVVRPYALQMMDSGWRPLDAARWPRCHRLDAQVDGCLFRVEGSTTSLADIAARLEMPVTLLASANSHIPPNSSMAIARGTDVVVWRGKMKLGGSRL